MTSYNSDLYDELLRGSNIVAGDEFQEIILAVSAIGSGVVVKTLGPYGSTTILDDATFTYPSKDGWATLRQLHFTDPVANAIFNVLKEVSFKLVESVGDGSTSSFVGADAFMQEIIKYQKTHDFRQVEFLNKLDETISKMITSLKSSQYVRYINRDGDFSDIWKIANISSNNNAVLANYIQKIYQETSNPNIYVTLDPSSDLSYEIQDGYKFDCYVMGHKSYINSDNHTYELDGPVMAAIFNHNITYNEHSKIVTYLSQYANAKGKQLFLFAPYFDDIMTQVIGANIEKLARAGQAPNIMLIQIPLSNEIQRKYFGDIVALTGSTVFDSGVVGAFNTFIHNMEHPDDLMENELISDGGEYGYTSIEDIMANCIGKIVAGSVGEKYVLINDYQKVIPSTKYKLLLEEAEQDYRRTKAKADKNTTIMQKDYLNAHQRYVKLIGKMGVIKVGGKSELEKHCLKDAVDDSVLACRSAYDHGYICGMNLSTLKVITAEIEKLEMKNSDPLMLDILKMMRNVFVQMTLNVMNNKFMNNPNPELVKREVSFINPSLRVSGIHNRINKIDAMDNREIIETCIAKDYGYNLVTEEIYMNEADCDVVNSVSTDIEILKAINSILSLMLTSSQFLSMNRSFNRKTSMKFAQEAKVAEQAEIAKAVTKEVVGVLRTLGITRKTAVNSLIDAVVDSTN